MNSKIKAGIYIGLLCSLWTFIMGITGWFKDPVLLNLFYVVIIIEIGVLVWGLKQTAKAGKTYGGQIVAGLTISVIGGIIIFAFSYIFTTFIFPSYFKELQIMYKGFLVAQKMTETEMAAHMRAYSEMQTPFWQALLGFIGTAVTGFIASLIISIFYRRKSQVA